MEPRRNSWTASHANILPRTNIYSNIKYRCFIKHCPVFIYLHSVSVVKSPQIALSLPFMHGCRYIYLHPCKFAIDGQSQSGYIGIYTNVVMKDDPRNVILLERFQERLASSPKRVYSPMDLAIQITQLHAEHAFPRSTSERKFQRLLLESGTLKEIALTATYPFEAKRYHWDSFSPHELALSIKPGSYLSHGTAAYLHNLTDREPETIYVNKEQSFKNSKGNLTQAGINRAFSNKQRHSGYVVTHNQVKITLLSGKHSDRLGVIKMTGRQGEQLELADLERTLIDISVRPGYAGGAKAVAEAYRRAVPKTSVTRLTGSIDS